MPPDIDVDPPRPPPPPEHELALAARALEYIRPSASPTEPLGAYVLTADSLLSEAIAGRIPWQHEGPYPRVVTEDGRLWVGWAPLAVIAAAVEVHSADDAAALRTWPASDAGLWTVVYVHESVVMARVARDELFAMELPGGERVTYPPEPEGAGAIRRPWEPYPGPRVYDSFTTRCSYGGGEHDGLGPRYVFFNERGELEIVARTCSKCESNSVVA